MSLARWFAVGVSLWSIACSEPVTSSEPSAHDAAPASASDSASAPPTYDPDATYLPQESGSKDAACTRPAADVAPVIDDCFAYDLTTSPDPEPYAYAETCGRNYHYFCPDAADGSAQMPQADCAALGKTYHSPHVHGYVCTVPTCVRWSSGDTTECGGKHAWSCPNAQDPQAPAAAGCTMVGHGEKGDPLFCCTG